MASRAYSLRRRQRYGAVGTADRIGERKADRFLRRREVYRAGFRPGCQGHAGQPCRRAAIHLRGHPVRRQGLHDIYLRPERRRACTRSPESDNDAPCGLPCRRAGNAGGKYLLHSVRSGKFPDERSRYAEKPSPAPRLPRRCGRRAGRDMGAGHGMKERTRY